MESVKDTVLKIIKKMPSDATYDDIMEAVYVNQKIDKGLEQLEHGEGLTIDQLRERLKKWVE